MSKRNSGLGNKNKRKITGKKTKKRLAIKHEMLSARRAKAPIRRKKNKKKIKY